MGHGKKCSSKKRGGKRFSQRCKEPIHQKRLQAHFLEHAESEVADEPSRLNKMAGHTMERTQEKADDGYRRDENSEWQESLARGTPKIICTPTESSGRVAVKDEAKNKPYRKYRPPVEFLRLQPPDIGHYESAEEKCFRKCDALANPGDFCPAVHARGGDGRAIVDHEKAQTPTG